MKRLVTRAAIVLSMAVAVVALGGSDAYAQKRPKKHPTSKPAGKKKPKKPGGKPGGKPVELGDLDEPVPPAGSGPAPGPAGSAPVSTPPPTSASDGSASPASGDDATDGDEAADATAAGSASADASTDSGKRISVALLLGVGINSTLCGTTSCNAYGFGVGLRGGYTLPMRLYLGGTFVYHLGASKEETRVTFKSAYTKGVSYVGPEVGYDIPVGRITVRPYLGLGLGLFSESLLQNFGANNGVVQSTGGSRFAFWPGVTGLYAITPVFFAGADMRFVVVTAAESAFSLFATGGMRF